MDLITRIVSGQKPIAILAKNPDRRCSIYVYVKCLIYVFACQSAKKKMLWEWSVLSYELLTIPSFLLVFGLKSSCNQLVSHIKLFHERNLF